VRVESLGGATEASIWSIHHPIGAVDPDWRSIPYGTPLRNQQFHVLDDAMRPRPTWVPGQLYIGGTGLAQGYWRDEATTAASFVRHPETGERLYRTGDLGRWRADGTIEFLGREDGQVKVHGYRIELGEIEAALLEHPAVTAAAVRLFGAAQGDKRLAAYVVSDVDTAELSAHLARRLPAYMMPHSVTEVEALPLSANGKVDRSQLPEPAAPVIVAPRLTSPEQRRLVAIVEGILDRGPIGLDANLLQAGATSIDVVRIANALSRDLGFRPQLAELMRHPTLADLLDRYAESSRPVLSAPTVVEDPAERKVLAARGPGRRTLAKSTVDIAVDVLETTRYAEYRSGRQFRAEPVELAALTGLLSGLAAHPIAGTPKFLYGSAGGTYPVQAYLYVRPGRVAGLPAGGYYHDPVGHWLVPVGRGELDPDGYDYFVNRPVFEAAAFALFLVTDLAAIEPLYGGQSLGFSQVEAGAMAQLLTMDSAGYELGLCGIGSFDLALLVDLFDLGPTHRLVYSLLGGGRPSSTVDTAGPEPDELEEVEI
jgi:SagB-type dehydrogenase family enzyme